ncbi:MAG: leucine-rich repeat domain-containing protein [Flavobacteriales bacterium]|nr:hypothetical protein [Flavobacteriales bacterium]MBX2958405.1 leucine-rich repeat domain-containing protein [Flavobacteriales bacterium]
MKLLISISILLSTLTSCSHFTDPFSFKTSSRIYELKQALRANPEKVKALTLRNYTDSVFPNENILKFRNLESIYIFGSEKMNSPFIKLQIDTNSLKKLTELNHLSFAYIDFKEFPKELLIFNNLKVLELGLTNINELPSDLNKLEKLELLSLRLNNLKSLPNSIVLINNLKVLDLGNNLFEKLPEILIQPNNLKYISFANPEGSFNTEKIVVPNNKINYLEEQNTLEKIVNQKYLERVAIEVTNCDTKNHLKNLFGKKLGIVCRDCD